MTADRQIGGGLPVCVVIEDDGLTAATGARPIQTLDLTPTPSRTGRGTGGHPTEGGPDKRVIGRETEYDLCGILRGHSLEVIAAIV